MSKISKEIAEQEVSKWLDFKRVKDSKREEMKDSIKSLEDAFLDGVLRLEDDGKLVQTLDFPLTNSDGETTVTELKYVLRLPMKNVNQSLEGLKASDVDGRMLGYVAAYTNQPRAVIGNVTSDDFKVCQNIILFFL